MKRTLLFRARQWLRHATLRQRWCGIATGHDYQTIQNLSDTIAPRSIQKQRWMIWRCKRCGQEFAACWDVRDAAASEAMG